MESPFPGMDPYLEGSSWQSFHSALAIQVAAQLSSRLPDDYVALPQREMVIRETDGISTISSRPIAPDVSLVAEERARYRTGGAALLERPLKRTVPMPQRIGQTFVEIRFVEQYELVTAIEILSPSNKTGEGREEYLGKRRRILASESNLVEIDLIRRGVRLPVEESLPVFPYYIYTSRAEQRPSIDVWPVGLDEPLPVIQIPLRPPDDDDIELDLQEAITNVCASFRFERLIDYAKPPPPPELSQTQRQWALNLLQSKGFKPVW